MNKQKNDLKFMIANLITEIRYKKKITQTQIAKKIGTKQPAISRIESGLFIPSIKVLYKIASKCGCKLIIKII